MTGFHVRNLMSGLYNNWLAGPDPSPAKHPALCFCRPRRYGPFSNHALQCGQRMIADDPEGYANICDLSELTNWTCICDCHTPSTRLRYPYIAKFIHVNEWEIREIGLYPAKDCYAIFLWNGWVKDMTGQEMHEATKELRADW